MRYVAPDKRPGRPESTLGRVRRTMLTEEARSRQADRPFDPEAPREHYAGAHHFAVNKRGVEIETGWGTVGLVRGGGLSGKDAWSYAMRRGARNVYHNREQWSYALRNSQNIPMGEVERLQRQLEAEAPYAHRPNGEDDTEYSASRETIVDAMARTFFVTAWADAMEEAGVSLHGELMDQAPPTPREAEAFAEKAAERIESANGSSLEALYDRMANRGAAREHGREPTGFEFGYSLAMMYMGSGVSWFDDHPDDPSAPLDVPYGEGMYIELEEEDIEPGQDHEENEAHGRQFEVVDGDGRVISHITAATIEDARTDLARGKHGGWYPRDATVIKGERPEHEHTENARGPRGDVDEHAVTELVQFIENTSQLSIDGPRGQGNSILLNLMRKWRKGKYDFELSVKLFEYLAESGARAYANEYHEGSWSTMFNVPTRKEAAREMATSFRIRAEGGEFDHIDTKIRR